MYLAIAPLDVQPPDCGIVLLNNLHTRHKTCNTNIVGHCLCKWRGEEEGGREGGKEDRKGKREGRRG